MSNHIAVLGAGMVGVSVAWHLQKKGFQVTLIDRKRPGNETSFGNAGLIQREAIRPYPFPRDIKKVLKVLPNNQSDIRYRIREAINKALPLYRYWQNSESTRYQKIASEYASLIERSLDAHDEMIRSAGAENFISKRGYIEVYRSADAFQARKDEINEYLENSGLACEFLTGDMLKDMEPSLKVHMAGGVHWTQVWSASTPYDLVNAYFQDFERMGGRFIQGDIQSLSPLIGEWVIELKDQMLHFPKVVLCLGPWSAQWLNQHGIQVPLFFKRGYHAHFKHNTERTLNHPLLEAETGFALAPMTQGIRISSGADLSGLSDADQYGQLVAAELKAREILDLGERVESQPWSGARPCLPDMKPVIGAAEQKEGLWLAFGHGHQGFTLGPITGRLIAQLISGEAPEVDMAPFGVQRFCA